MPHVSNFAFWLIAKRPHRALVYRLWHCVAPLSMPPLRALLNLTCAPAPTRQAHLEVDQVQPRRQQAFLYFAQLTNDLDSQKARSSPLYN